MRLESESNGPKQVDGIAVHRYHRSFVDFIGDGDGASAQSALSKGRRTKPGHYRGAVPWDYLSDFAEGC